jgi:hypothetical protein
MPPTQQESFCKATGCGGREAGPPRKSPPQDVGSERNLSKQYMELPPPEKKREDCEADTRPQPDYDVESRPSQGCGIEPCPRPTRIYGSNMITKGPRQPNHFFGSPHFSNCELTLKLISFPSAKTRNFRELLLNPVRGPAHLSNCELTPKHISQTLDSYF